MTSIPIWQLDAGGERRAEESGDRGSLAEAAETEPENGVYLVARTYQGLRVLDLDGHMDRMERSAAALGRELRLPRSELRRRVREIADAVGAGASEVEGRAVEIRFRLTAVLDQPVWFRLAAEPARELSGDLVLRGATCCLSPGWERTDPTVKSTDWMAARRSLQGECYEHLLVRADGQILEGATSNFYAIRDGVLRTAGAGVLEGIARRVILQLAGELAPPLPVVLEAPTVAELEAGRLDEAFISSATRGIVPVSRIGDVGLGGPGPRTGELRAAWDRWLTAHLEPLVSG